MTIALRPATPADFEFFYATRKACFPIAWDDFVHRTEAEIEFREMELEIVEDDGVAIGYLAVKHEPDHHFLEEIALLVRNRGIGSQLVRDMMTAAQAAYLPLRLSVREENPAARRLYERLGFRITRLEPPRIKMEWP
jgi:ribosomal protein S18 acetylase RimI-like enzyme